MSDEFLEPPPSTPEYMQGAWAAALEAAIQYSPFREAFEKESGLKWTIAKSPIDAMIDEATGWQKVYVFRFADWFNKNVWGEM